VGWLVVHWYIGAPATSVGELVVHWYNAAEFGAPATLVGELVVHWYNVAVPEFGAELGELAQKRVVGEDESTDELVKDASTTDELVKDASTDELVQQ